MMVENVLELIEHPSDKHPFADDKSIIGIENLQEYLSILDLEDLKILAEEVKKELEFRVFSICRMHDLRNKLSVEKYKLKKELEELKMECMQVEKELEEHKIQCMHEELRMQNKQDEFLNEDEISSNTDETMAGVRKKNKKTQPRKIPVKKSKSKK